MRSFEQRPPTTAPHPGVPKASTGDASAPFVTALCRDGTTDITRTVHWGEPTPLQKVPVPPMSINVPLHCSALAMALSTTILARVGCAGVGVCVPPPSPPIMPYRKPTPEC